MSVDLIVQSGTKFALEQWLDARALGNNVQDTDPESPTFGDYFYTATVGQQHYWNAPSGKLPQSIDTYYDGFWMRLGFTDDQWYSTELTNLREWTENNTAFSGIPPFNGVGGEGITILNPEDIYTFLSDSGLPAWGGLLGVANQWSDPSLWAFSNVMTGDQREFDGVTWESTIDFNVWAPTQYPQGWIRV